MTLQEFIDRALAFFTKAEGNLTAEEKLATANGRMAELEKANAQLVSDLNTAKASIESLSKSNTQLKADVTALEGKLKETEASVDQRAGSKALAIAERQGIPAVAEEKAGSSGQTLSYAEHWKAWQALKDPKAQAEYYEKNKAAMQG